MYLHKERYVTYLHRIPRIERARSVVLVPS